MTDRNGTLHTVTYDKNGNPLTKTSAKGGQTITKTYTYNSMGNLATANDGTGVIVYAYDGMGSRVSETQGTLVKIITYDQLGNVTGYTITENDVPLQSVTNEYDNYGRLAQVKENNVPVAAYTYDKGRLRTTTYTNGSSETISYNNAGMITAVYNRNSAGTVLSSYSYTYYYDGNQYQKKEPAGTTTYTYDYMNRLKTALLPDGTLQTYEFDDNSNRDSLTVTVGAALHLRTLNNKTND